MTSFYTNAELLDIGFKAIGENVLISRKTSLYGVSRISVGSNVRIDDFCVLSAGKGGITLGNYVHIAIYSSLQGDGAIIFKDFTSISSKVSIYSSNEDFSGDHLTSPLIPDKYRGAFNADVVLHKHSIVGSGSVILPGVTLNEGAVVGALSMVNNDCEAFFVYMGNPAKKLFERRSDLLELEKEFMASFNK